MQEPSEGEGEGDGKAVSVTWGSRSCCRCMGLGRNGER